MMDFLKVLTLALPMATLANAQTPFGSQTSTNNSLTITYNSPTITAGQLFLPSELGNEPSISYSQQLSGTYLLLFVDLSLGAASAARALKGTGGLASSLRCNGTTRLHWAQGNVTQTANGSLLTNNSPAISIYDQPNPPVSNPTPNVYTFYLFNQPSNFTLPAWDAGRDLYDSSAADRLNFSVQAIADVVGNPVAASFLQASKNGTSTTQVPLTQLNQICGSALNTTNGSGVGNGSTEPVPYTGAANGMDAVKTAVWVLMAALITVGTMTV